MTDPALLEPDDDSAPTPIEHHEILGTETTEHGYGVLAVFWCKLIYQSSAGHLGHRMVQAIRRSTDPLLFKARSTAASRLAI